MNAPTLRRNVLILAVMLVPLAACSDPAAPPMEEEEACSGADDLAGCLPSWSSYAPLGAEVDSVTTSESTEVTEELERFDDVTGELVNLGAVTFVCTDVTHDFRDTPGELITGFGIDQTKIWPGALIQGRSHRDGAGSLLELPIRERAPINVSVSFNNSDNTRLVDSPDNSSIGQALGEMIEGAAVEGTVTANNITFSQETYSSEQQAALAFGVSGRYLGFEASATGSVTSSVTTNVIAAQFMQEMYVAGVTQPATPADFFSDALTNERYQVYANAGQVGPSNPPLYVSRVGFGRMMVFSMSAKAEANEIKGALSVAYNGIGAGGSANLSAKETSILQSAELRISQIGGDQQNALAAISSGDLKDYFADAASLQSAAPLWFELKSMTGEIAYVSEAGTYTETTCVPKLPGTFDYAEEQSVSVPFTSGTERSTLWADVNGDDRMDLVFNERSTTPALNRTHVALSSGNGVFTVQAAWDHPETPTEGWQNYMPLVADVDGDGSDDLVWNVLTTTNNVVYGAMSNGNGTYTATTRQERPATGWHTYRSVAGDLDGDGMDDLLFSNAGNHSSLLRTYYALARGDGTFYFGAPFVDRSGDFSGYDAPVLAQFDGFGGLDFALNAIGGTYNNTYVGLFTSTSDSTGTITYTAPLVAGSGYSPYRLQIGNVDGTNAADLIWVDQYADGYEGRTYVARNRGDGTFDAPTLVFDERIIGDNEPFAGDFNNDGHADILMIHRTSDTNQILTGFGFGDADGFGFTFPAGLQTHPNVPTEGWDVYDDIFIGDVTGDRKADVVWTNPSSDTRIYVAIAK